MIRVKLRLYRAHDYDLLSLYKSVGKKTFAKAARDILMAYATGKEYAPEDMTLSDVMEPGDKSAAVTCNLQITDKEPEAMELVLGVTAAKRASFIKNIMRVYLFRVLSPVWFGKETDAEVITAASVLKPERQKKPEKKEKEEEQKSIPKASPEPAGMQQDDDEEEGFDALAELFGGLTVN